MRGIRSKLRDESGAAIVLIAVSMVALISAIALAVDVGMLVTARTEAQTLADASALAGASALIDFPGDEDAARARAIAWATNNTVQRENVTVLPEDVDVLLDEWKVRVRVLRTEARGNAVPTFFARIFGVNQVGIAASAAAEASPAGTAGGDPTASCLLPVALIDKFTDNNGNGDYDAGDTYDPDGGYDADDHGKLIKLKIHSTTGLGPPQCRTDATDPHFYNAGDPDFDSTIDYCQDGGESSSWRCWWRESPPDDGGGGGTGVLGPRIYPATDCGPEMSIDDPVWAASGSGNKQSLVNGDANSFAELIRHDTDNLVWCESCAGGVGCVAEAFSSECFTDDNARIRQAPVIDPTSIGMTGAGTTATIADFIGVFVEQVACAHDAPQLGDPDGRWNVYIRLIVDSGSGGSDESAEDASTLLRILRLVE